MLHYTQLPKIVKFLPVGKQKNNRSYRAKRLMISAQIETAIQESVVFLRNPYALAAAITFSATATGTSS